MSSAALAEALAESCRLARSSGDLAHYKRHREALEQCLQFISRLQYTEANTQHFADWYRPALVGAFYALMALGLSLILNLSGVINFAHGGFLALGAYFAYSLMPFLGFWGALLIAPVPRGGSDGSLSQCGPGRSESGPS